MAKLPSLTAPCPDCGEEVSFLARPRVDDEIECASCGTLLCVVSVVPLELDWALSLDDRYEDSDEYDEDDFDYDDDEYAEDGENEYEDEDEDDFI